MNKKRRETINTVMDKIEIIIDKVELVLEKEEKHLDKLGDGGTIQIVMAEQSCNYLKQAIDALDNAYDLLEKAKKWR